MKLDRRFTNGLAWAGALLVVGVPAADFLAGRLTGAETPRVAVVETQDETAAAVVPAAVDARQPVETAARPPAETAETEDAPVEIAAAPTSARPGDAVQDFIDSGRALPSYITGGGTAATAPASQPAATTPAVTVPAATTPSTPPPAVAATQPTTPDGGAQSVAPPQPTETVAALPPKVAPVPMPASMRPVAAVRATPQEQPLIITEPSPIVTPTGRDDLVTADDLEAWESGPLSDFLAQRQQQGSSASYRVQNNENAMGSGGFWLDELPTDRRGQRFPPAYDDGYSVPFSR